MKKTITTAAAGLALLAFPVLAADAKPGKGNGQGHGHAQSQDARGDGGPGQRAADQRGNAGTREHRGRGRDKRCSKGRKVGFALRGTLAGHTGDEVTIAVVRANKHARSFVEGTEHTFALEGARVKFEGVTDSDGSGEVDLADVAPTDVVKATGKVTRPKRGCEAQATVTLRKLHVERPQADEAEEGDES